MRKDREVSNETQDLSTIETRLQRSLRPVSPRPVFISDLRKQLVSQLQVLPTISHFGRSSVLWLGLFLVLLVFGMILMSLRSVILLLSFITLFQQYQRQNPVSQDRMM